MKILYMTMRYNLDAEGLYQNLVDALLDNGHEVTIVRSNPDVVNSGLFTPLKNLKVLDVKTGDPFESNLVKKGINQISLNFFFKKEIKKFLKNEKFDIILYATPPVTLADTVKYCKKKYNAKTFLMLKDIFPQNAVDLDMIRKPGLIYSYFRIQEKKYYYYSDFIGCMSNGNMDFVKKHNPLINRKKIGLFPNSIKIDDKQNTEFNDEKTIFMFGGNLGKPQNIPMLLKIAKKMEDYNSAEFIIVGDGSEKEKILDFQKENRLSNLKYHDRLPQAEYERFLLKADVGLISLDPRFTIPNIPSRFQSYMKMNKPVLAITDTNTDLKDMIVDNDCGWWCDAMDEEKIIATIKYICEHKDEQKIKGKNGFSYLNKAFNIKDNVETIEKFYSAFKERK